MIFDKFLPDNARLPLPRRLLNLDSTRFGTDITRRIGDLTARAGFQVVREESSRMKGTFRVVLVRKQCA